ncbi:hypothetical protein GN956_G4187 [Arapaima gigas]
MKSPFHNTPSRGEKVSVTRPGAQPTGPGNAVGEQIAILSSTMVENGVLDHLNQLRGVLEVTVVALGQNFIPDIQEQASEVNGKLCDPGQEIIPMGRRFLWSLVL